MGCGCGGGKRNVTRRTVNGIRANRVSSGPISGSVQSGISAGASPEQIRALGLQSNTAPKTVQKLDADKRRVEKLRRAAIRKALNK